LKLGLLLLGAGTGLLLAFIISNNMRGHDHEAIYFALIAIGGGLGLVGSYFMEKKEYDNSRELYNQREVTTVREPRVPLDQQV
jgi:hypothetical protein